MDCFKTKPGISRIFKITEENYLDETGKKAPFCQRNHTGGDSFFAVCPECDNPIQIVGLYKNTRESGKTPYGRHHKGSVTGLAEYHEEDYYNCFYAKPQWKRPHQKRSAGSPLARRILKLLRTQYDRVIYILSQDMEMQISSNLAKTMLKKYMGEKGWLYRGATMNNLPWMVGEANQAIPLFGRRVLKNSPLYHAIEQNCPRACFDSKEEKRTYQQVIGKEKTYLNVHFLLYNHQKMLDGEQLRETIDFWVYEGNAPTLRTIYKKTIPIRLDYFLHLIHLPEKKAKRNQNYLRIADECIKIERKSEKSLAHTKEIE